MNLGSSRGIVLRVLAYGEADKLVTLYTQEGGRMTLLAKGAQKSRKRFVNKLEAFSALHFLYRPARGGSGLPLLIEAELVCAHLSLRKSYPFYVAASYLSELLLCFTREHDPDPRLYTLLQWALSSLEQGLSPGKITLFFHLRLLDAAGYRPELRSCSQCRRPLAAGGGFMFFPEKGGLRCAACQEGGTGPLSGVLSARIVKLLAHAQQLALERAHRLHISPQAAAEAMDLLHHYTLHTIQQDIRAWQALHTLLISPAQKA